MRLDHPADHRVLHPADHRVLHPADHQQSRHRHIADHEPWTDLLRPFLDLQPWPCQTLASPCSADYVTSCPSSWLMNPGHSGGTHTRLQSDQGSCLRPRFLRPEWTDTFQKEETHPLRLEFHHLPFLSRDQSVHQPPCRALAVHQACCTD